MPILPSHYQAPWYLFNGHLQTIIPAVLNRPATNIYTRERINTSDHDFLDLDLIKKGHDKLVVLQGLDDFIIVDTNDVLLICKKEKEQSIKEYVAEVKRNKGDKFL